MCYSAQIKADFHHFVREWGAVVSMKRFVELFWEKRQDGQWTKIPKAIREAFRRPEGEEGFALAKLVAEADREQAERYQAELSAQTARLGKAEAVLAGSRPTKRAADDQRIATNKIKAGQRNLDDLQRTELVDRDSRIYPDSYATVMIENEGQRIVVPMRYQCRLPGWNDVTERKYPGTTTAGTAAGIKNSAATGGKVGNNTTTVIGTITTTMTGIITGTMVMTTMSIELNSYVRTHRRRCARSFCD